MSDALKQLLERADARLGTPSDPSAIASSVRQRRVNQIHRQRTALAMTCVLLALGTLWLVPSRVPPSTTRAPALASVTETDIDARIHRATADALAQCNRTRHASARAQAQPDVLQQVQFQRDRAALTLIYEADRFTQQPHQTDQAIAQYRKVIKLFPTSRYANVARQRLREFQS